MNLSKKQEKALQTLNAFARHIGKYEGLLLSCRQNLWRSDTEHKQDEETTIELLNELYDTIMEQTK